MASADSRTPLSFSLSPGSCHDGPQGELLIQTLPEGNGLPMVMDRAYSGNGVRQLAFDFGYIPVVPPKSNMKAKWEYDEEIYKKRNEIERLFRRLKGFRRIFSRFDKLDVHFIGFIHFAVITEFLKLC